MSETLSFAGVSKAIKALKNQQPTMPKSNTTISKTMANEQDFKRKFGFPQKVLNGYI
ncbi:MULTISPECIES: hypothetical protein [Cyanophyceae]|uniref:hypothetical protein n=1 Tax=Cyanophyceae TaxID=3028117 RepID=UPI001686D43B|nr:hypothetical protein [Nodosilinea sp. FACHB-141]